MQFKKKIPPKAKTYVVHGAVSGTKYLGKVVAFSKEEAEKKAWELGSIGVCMCWACSKECEDPEVTEIIVEEE